MLYNINAQIMESLRPVHVMARMTRQFLYQPTNPLNYSWTYRTMRASMELVERITDFYEEPAWGLDSTEIDGREVAISYEVIQSKPYCNLLHFKREKAGLLQPKVLMIAPMSGHFATLLRGTVNEFLPDHEVYITDWKNARDVPMADGTFHFDDYVDYLIDFLQTLGPDVHVMAVCQPCVPALVAAALMAMHNDPCLPASMTLMGGPIDVRINPTGVNDYASGKDLEWFEDNVIMRVPRGFAGRGQLVYPGFIQLSGFMSMNWDTHMSKHFKFFTDLVKGDGESAEGHRLFYNEYLAVMDMPAHYYLDTIRKVFLEQALPKGEMEHRGHPVDLTAITDMSIMTIEGELDDITGRGQTACALDICSGIPADRKRHLEAEGVGHYGIFNGRRFREMIAPQIKEFMAAAPVSGHESKIALPAVVAAPAEPKKAAVSPPEPVSALVKPGQPAAPAPRKRSSRATKGAASTPATDKDTPS
ncbi:polyhydroxyalkanoate depolymerase [Oceanobacter mangrovi]|uniref:polyhydroxyalkanoate depolymerase n=1 Tax=Oceanobacter mangrovi TaxID=2862510 RepID=UPI001C8DBDA2|nr:polyhydroxyalkanoate depolymerase [Oceanobacter mangrovi]